MKAVIEGWIARDEELDTSFAGGTDLWLYPSKPVRCVGNFIDHEGCCMSLPTNLFPTLRWNDEPKEVIITIETKED